MSQWLIILTCLYLQYHSEIKGKIHRLQKNEEKRKTYMKKSNGSMLAVEKSICNDLWYIMGQGQ